MAAKPEPGSISGVARPTPLMRNMALAMHGPSFAHDLDSMIEDAVAVTALAGAMDRAMAAATNASGNVDMKNAAMNLIREMRSNQK